MTILVPARSAADWRPLLADLDKHWKDGFSAKAAGLPPEVANLLGPQARLLLAIPEHKVALPGGSRESQCDVFALVDLGDQTCAVAVEAKVNEPFGPTVEEWQPDSTAGRRARLDAILAMLGLETLPAGIRYQLLHRTAAAVVESARFRTGAAAMLVQSFSRDRRWFADFAAFCACLGHDAAPDRPIEHRLGDGRRLILGWASGSPADPGG